MTSIPEPNPITSTILHEMKLIDAAAARREAEENEIPNSDCCGADSIGEMFADYNICPHCREHTVFRTDSQRKRGELP